MGNREALLMGAKRCLLERGYAQTTARDIAKEAGVSLAAIGYHFSSKEALMMEALLLAFDDWDRDFRRLLESGVPQNASPVERFESTWARLMDTFETHRSLWTTNMEVFSQVSRMPELRRTLAGSLATARSELASLFLGKDRNAVSEETA
ncbi:MAG: helix-turn-helix domain-containing protein, partial [Bryobacteraceae bacterium]